MSKTYRQILPLDVNETVANQFGWLPLSVICTIRERNDWWERREAYLPQIEDEQRRSSDVEYLPGLSFSEFHADLAEKVLKYWSLPGSTIVDPFAGRATRAVVSSLLKRQYFGFEISPRTVARCLTHFNITLGEVYADFD